MAKKANAMRWIVIVGGVAFFVVLIYLSMGQMQQGYEVCMSFKGATHCSTAKGANYNEAVRSAQEIDCQMLASGRDQTMACMSDQPSSIRQLNK